MCGIAGIFDPRGLAPEAGDSLRQMLAIIRHRGPDEFGSYQDSEAALGSARLSIIDLSTGQQPIGNEDGTLWIVFNGEVFNYVELRPELEARGHRFTTRSDTEVILHLYEEFGPACLSRLNGQFAIAIWNRRDRTLFLARDRLGVRPLFYTQQGGALYFGSEIKALLVGAPLRAELDPAVVQQVFTYWCPLSPNTVFRGVRELPPAHYLLAGPEQARQARYWQLDFPPETTNELGAHPRSLEDALDEFRGLLVDAARVRLRADVPVGAYLSGGLDSSTIASVIRRYTSNRLDTFSIAFTDTGFDESAYQQQMAEFLGTDHHVVHATHADIGRAFPDVIWHTETPLTRTAPAPMFLLSNLVRQQGYKVVLTGEGADEFLAGYDIFKEAKVRRFWARQPGSPARPRLLQRLYPDIQGLAQSGSAFLAAFFREGLTEVDAPLYSHAVRWRNNRRTLRFFSDDALRAQGAAPSDMAWDLPERFGHWHPLARAQYLEITIFLSQYLLSSQGDRMGMAHSIEGRFPFLDHRLVEFCNRLPPTLKLRGLTEKYLLKQLTREWLPAEIRQRPKRPYRAPIHRSFFNEDAPDYVGELLSPARLQATGLFKPAAVAQLVGKIHRGLPLGETDDMALAGILSTQLVHELFVDHFRKPAPLAPHELVKACAPKPPS